MRFAQALTGSALALAICFVGCSGGSDDPGGTANGAGEGNHAGATNSAAGEGAGNAPDPGAEPEVCGGDAELETACTTLCDAFHAADCTLMDLIVKDVYRLYVNGGDDDCVAECVAGDLRQDSLPDAPTKCGPELRAYIERIAQNECLGADPSKNWNGQWDWEGAEAEQAALGTCAGTCLDLAGCDPATCNGSMSAGGVFCTWACRGRSCEQTCN